MRGDYDLLTDYDLSILVIGGRGMGGCLMRVDYDLLSSCHSRGKISMGVRYIAIIVG